MQNTAEQLNCDTRIAEHLQGRLDDLRVLYDISDQYLYIDRVAESYVLKYHDMEIDTLDGEDLQPISELFSHHEDSIQEQVMEARSEYGLSIDYVPHDGEFNDGAGYLRYQLSWGGPSDEFRFFLDADQDCYRVEYWFLDWFDGASRTLHGDDVELLNDIFQDFKDCGIVEAEIEKAGVE